MNDELKELLAASPFVAFAIVLASGDRYRVENPIMVIVADATITVVRPRAGKDVLRFAHVVAFEVLEPVS